jgi:hypothetical protein
VGDFVVGWVALEGDFSTGLPLVAAADALLPREPRAPLIVVGSFSFSIIFNLYIFIFLKFKFE